MHRLTPNRGIINPKGGGQSSEEAISENDENSPVAYPVLENWLNSPHFSSMVNHISFRGPLPPPAMLREYNQIIENAAERIMAQSEREQAHRHALQHQTLAGAISKDRRGQWMAFIITLFILLMAAVFAWRGNTSFAGMLITVDLIGLASVFAIGRIGMSANKVKEKVK